MWSLFINEQSIQRKERERGGGVRIVSADCDDFSGALPVFVGRVVEGTADGGSDEIGTSF